MNRHSTLRLILSLCLLVPVVSGCGDYPKLSGEAYDLSSALYSSCRRGNADSLTRIAELTDSSLEEGKISEKEADWIRDIISQAEGGDWKGASAEARAMMESQVEGR